MHSPGYRESCLLRLAFSPLGHLSGHPARVWPALRGCSAFPAQSQTMVAASLGAECLRDAAGPGGGAAGSLISCPLALATCCQARAVSCFSSSSVVRGDHPPHCQCALYLTGGSTWKGGFTDAAACQRPRCWLPEQDCSCLPGIFVLD